MMSVARGPGAKPNARMSDLILQTALRLFTQQGYAATSIEQVAAACGCGKHTVYRRHPNKQALFAAVVDLQSDKLSDRISALPMAGGDPLATLKALCLDVLEVYTTPEFIDFHRMCIAEARSQVEIRPILGRNNALLVETGERLVRQAQASGQMRGGDPGFLMRQLAQAALHYPLDELLLCQPEFQTRQARRDYFEQGWTLFFEGAAPRVGRL